MTPPRKEVGSTLDLTFSIAAWTVLGFVIIGLVTSVPIVEQRLHAVETAGGAASVLEGALLGLAGLAAAVLWVSGVIHAYRDARPGPVPRPVLVTVLILGNFVAAFFYYFLAVVWDRGQWDS